MDYLLKFIEVMFVQLVSKIFNLCGHDPLVRHRRTDRIHAIV